MLTVTNTTKYDKEVKVVYLTLTLLLSFDNVYKHLVSPFIFLLHIYFLQ